MFYGDDHCKSRLAQGREICVPSAAMCAKSDRKPKCCCDLEHTPPLCQLLNASGLRRLGECPKADFGNGWIQYSAKHRACHSRRTRRNLQRCCCVDGSDNSW